MQLGEVSNRLAHLGIVHWHAVGTCHAMRDAADTLLLRAVRVVVEALGDPGFGAAGA